MSDRLVSVVELRLHKTAPEDIWIVVDGAVWDISEFAPSHPGGTNIIYKYAGLDASKAYNEIHSSSLIIETLGPSKRMGVLDPESVDEQWQSQYYTSKSTGFSSTSSSSSAAALPPLQSIINSFDFEEVSKGFLTPKTWAFYSSAATDLITMRANRSFLDSIWFRPRGLVNVRKVSTRSKILGINVDLPLFVAPAALAKLAHPEGEKALAKSCERTGIPQCISTNASYSLSEVAQAASKDTPLFFQLYVNKDRAKSAALVAQAEQLGIKAIFLTIDAPDPGKREADERVKSDQAFNIPMTGQSTTNDKKGGGVARTTGAFIDDSLTWEIIDWLKGCTKLPLVIKGVQSAADAKRAMEAGVAGIVVSNHGGRCLDTSPPSILTLLEIHRLCPQVFERMEVYLDGGIRRGTDILKALCLGATAVSVGRPFLYSLAYGEEGAVHLVNILKDEMISNMKTLGITDVEQVHPGLVNTLAIDHMVPSTEGHPYIQWKKARL